jgi:hypothetical protein
VVRPFDLASEDMIGAYMPNLLIPIETDVIGKQVRMGDGYFPVLGHKKPPFDLPVVYEDDYFAIGKSSKCFTRFCMVGSL